MPARPAVEALWLATLQRIAGRAAHEVKGALNGVSVNLEVVRLRSARPDAPASAVASFADTAVGQLEALTAMTEALLTLARPAREPVELSKVLGALGALLVPAARAEGVTLTVPDRYEDALPVATSGAVARLLLGSALLTPLDGKFDAVVGVGQGGIGAEAVEVTVRAVDGRAVMVPDDVLAAAADDGVTVDAGDAGLTMAFPRETRVHQTAR